MHRLVRLVQALLLVRLADDHVRALARCLLPVVDVKAPSPKANAEETTGPWWEEALQLEDRFAALDMTLVCNRKGPTLFPAAQQGVQTLSQRYTPSLLTRSRARTLERPCCAVSSHTFTRLAVRRLALDGPDAHPANAVLSCRPFALSHLSQIKTSTTRA
jgi:hypothetical protein